MIKKIKGAVGVICGGALLFPLVMMFSQANGETRAAMVVGVLCLAGLSWSVRS